MTRPPRLGAFGHDRLTRHARLARCEHPLLDAGTGRCATCDAYPSIAALVDEIARREHRPVRYAPRPALSALTDEQLAAVHEFMLASRRRGHRVGRGVERRRRPRVSHRWVVI